MEPSCMKIIYRLHVKLQKAVLHPYSEKSMTILSLLIHSLIRERICLYSLGVNWILFISIYLTNSISSPLGVILCWKRPNGVLITLSSVEDKSLMPAFTFTLYFKF